MKKDLTERITPSTIRAIPMKYLSLVLLSVAFFLALPRPAHAATCTPIYGGGPVCTGAQITIQKQVLNPKTNLFVHDLGQSDPKYHGNDLVTFQVTLTNNSANNISTVTVQDNFPRELTFKDGPGTYDQNNRTLTFSVNNLAAHQSQIFTITATLLSQDQFPAGQSTFCTGNGVIAVPSNGQIAQDSSQFCVEKLTSTPSTGPEALGLLALVPTFLAGIALRKHAQ